MRSTSQSITPEPRPNHPSDSSSTLRICSLEHGHVPGCPAVMASLWISALTSGPTCGTPSGGPGRSTPRTDNRLVTPTRRRKGTRPRFGQELVRRFDRVDSSGDPDRAGAAGDVGDHEEPVDRGLHNEGPGFPPASTMLPKRAAEKLFPVMIMAAPGYASAGSASTTERASGSNFS
jgi:hypothetical protein